MKILISNDDGITAPGLAALVRAFSAAGHEIIVCAPDGQRSAASHSLTIAGKISVRRTTIEGALGYAIGGTPADCVKIGLRTLTSGVDFVLSGINKGYNMGSDVLYSGTVAAAMEAALAGVPAMAVSIGKDRTDHYDLAANTAVRVFDLLQKHPLRPYTMMNLNIPETDEILGMKSVPLRALRYDDRYVPCGTEDGTQWYALEGWLEPEAEPGDDDQTWLGRGYATLTVLGFDLAEAEDVEKWRGILNIVGE